jgi:death on curing protein
MSSFSIGRPRFLSAQDSIAYHEMLIAEYGGASGVRDRGLLESALAAPRQGWGNEYAYSYPFGMAAAYAYHLAKNHPFVDGNKRIALLCCGTFLRMNGWDLASQGVEAADAILALVTDQWDKPQMEQWLREHCIERRSFELRDFFVMADGAKYRALLESMRAGRDTEVMASINEAAGVIPIAEELVRLLNSVPDDERGGDVARAALNDLVLLAALYRLAEDMGYEW